MIQTCTEGALGMIEHGYEEPTRCLQFRVDCGGQAPEACRIIESYNAFDGEAVAEALEAIVEEYGNILETIEVGREYSPVIYIHLDSGAIVDQGPIMVALDALGADEVTYRDHTIRAWWD